MRANNLTEMEFMMARVSKQPNGCWQWTGEKINSTGYGRVTYWSDAEKRKISTNAHRYMYLLVTGPIPKGYVVDHLCRNTLCVNPEHLEAVTNAENMRRAVPFTTPHNVFVTHCPRGHEYSPENTYINASTGGRHCRTCATDHKRRWKEKQKELRAAGSERTAAA